MATVIKCGIGEKKKKKKKRKKEKEAKEKQIDLEKIYDSRI